MGVYENIEHEVMHSHNLEHVDLSSSVGKGDGDAELAAYLLEASRVIVTDDDDFLTDPRRTRSTLGFGWGVTAMT